MANVVNLDRVSKAYPNAVLLDAVSLGLDEADRVGVVGLNGAGKSTLLRLLTRIEEPDAGRVTHRRDLRVAWLPQTLELAPTATVRDVVLGTAWQPQGFAAEHEWAGDAGVRAILTGLGMGYLGLDAPVGPMSGGEQSVRLAGDGVGEPGRAPAVDLAVDLGRAQPVVGDREHPVPGVVRRQHR